MVFKLLGKMTKIYSNQQNLLHIPNGKRIWFYLQMAGHIKILFAIIKFKFLSVVWFKIYNLKNKSCYHGTGRMAV